MVLRVPIGGYLTGGAIWHSQCGESIFAHVPGLLIAFPSRARDAAGLLRYRVPRARTRCCSSSTSTCCASPTPSTRSRRPTTSSRSAGATCAAPGDDLTIVTWGATVEKSLAGRGAVRPSATGIEVEVIDLRTIVAVGPRARGRERGRARTGCSSCTRTCSPAGFGAEVAAWAAEHCFTDLDAPVRRVAALDTHVAYEPTLEDAILPQVDDIVDAITDLCAF